MKLDKKYLLQLAKKREKIVIHTQTQEEWNNIVSVLEDKINNYWDIYREKTCLNVNEHSLTWERLEYYQDKEYKILSYEDCCKKSTEIKEELKTINIKIGDEIGKLIITKTALQLLKNGEKIRVV